MRPQMCYGAFGVIEGKCYMESADDRRVMLLD
jgi:hypothetical protein